MSSQDYYETLSVQRSASADEIKSAYRKQAMRWHPDRNPDDAEAERRFKEASEAYAVLHDTDKRAAYDRVGHEAFVAGAQASGGGGGGGAAFTGDFSDILNEVFSGAFGNRFSGGRASARGRGADREVGIEITLEEAFSGLEQTLDVRGVVQCKTCDGTGDADNRPAITCADCDGRGQSVRRHGPIAFQQPCERCGGAGRVPETPCRRCRGVGRVEGRRTVRMNLPAGVETGQRLRLTGSGDAPGVPGAPPGDLYVGVSVRDHPDFLREGTLLLRRLRVSVVRAALGGRAQVRGIDGRTLEAELPAGVQHAQRLRLRGEGMPVISRGAGGKRGDLLVEVSVVVPTRLGARARALLEELEGELDDDIDDAPASPRATPRNSPKSSTRDDDTAGDAPRATAGARDLGRKAGAVRRATRKRRKP